LLVGAAVRPVREAAGQPVGAELVHDACGHDIEMRRERIDPESLGHVPDLAHRPLQLGQLLRVHAGTASRVVKKRRSAGNTSSLLVIVTPRNFGSSMCWKADMSVLIERRPPSWISP